MSLRHAGPACTAIGEALRFEPEFHLVAIASTVMPGATEGALTKAIADASGKRAGAEFAVCYAPEFVALGTAIRDFLVPDFVLIGEPDPVSGDLLEGVFQRLCENDPPVVHTSPLVAELAKLAVNAFLATKITFANVLARICEGLPGCDVDAVTSVAGRDSRVGTEYLTGAMGFGGPCLPRDTAAIAALARSLGAPSELADAVLEINGALLDRLVQVTKAVLPPGGRVGICGLAFKPGTDVVEASPGEILARRLAADGISVIAFDPMLVGPRPAAVGEPIELAPSLEQCVARADVIVPTTRVGSFAHLDASLLEGDGRRRTIIDCWRVVDPAQLQVARHIPLGRGSEEPVDDRPRVAGAI